MTAPVFDSVDRIIRQAYADAGYTQDGTDPTTFQVQDALSRFNDIINFSQTQGLKLWTNRDYSLGLVSGQAMYSLADTAPFKPLRIIDAYYSDSNGIRRPLVLIGRMEYDRLSQVTQTGQINSVYVDKQMAALNVYLWLVPDDVAATGTVHLIEQQQITNAVSTADSLYFPPEWYIYLRWALAEELSTGQPETIMNRCTLMAERYRKALENWDVEDASTTFAPDNQRR